MSAADPDLVLEPLVLLCPACGRQHIDEGTLAIEPHVKHACLHCGHEWRPREHATVGVPLGALSFDWLMAIGRSLGWYAAHAIDYAWARREVRPAPPPSSVSTVPPPPVFRGTGPLLDALKDAFAEALPHGAWARSPERLYLIDELPSGVSTEGTEAEADAARGA